ncbi:hypothetical protein GCM10011517_12330 [Actibacterium pelagium]|uniref:Uncharacterized protein n=1 Tax=Actibacterium pelagium TaxID=2029103 RepID=A0A917AG61_9RHOB|nr:hypothetical protein GCM10011517_12330 [Actibacterium pelagium]
MLLAMGKLCRMGARGATPERPKVRASSPGRARPSPREGAFATFQGGRNVGCER